MTCVYISVFVLQQAAVADVKLFLPVLYNNVQVRAFGKNAPCISHSPAAIPAEKRSIDFKLISAESVGACSQVTHTEASFVPSSL